ncbi:MAG: TonB-dependent receptor [Bacteroidota bacterium]|nr:TonB-dependent receptor [Bacteroidota bacterium]
MNIRCVNIRWVIIVLILFTSTVRSQILRVADDMTGAPIAHAVVSGGGKAVITDEQGKADIALLTGAEQIGIEAPGYTPLALAFSELKRREYKVFLERRPYRLGEVIVSASRRSQPEEEIPFRTAVIRAADRDLANPQTAADLLGSSGEVFIQKSQLAGGSPMIRGFATNRVLIAVDNVRMNTAIFRTGNVQNVISIDPFAVERTEVLFGPGSVMYGSDAIGGVMSFHTLTPRLSGSDETLFSGTAAVRTSSANVEKTAHVDLSLGLRRWGFTTSVTWSDFDDLVMGKSGPSDFLRTRYVERIGGMDSIVTNPDPEKQVPSGYSQWNILQKIRWKPETEWDLLYGFQYSTTSDYPRYDRLLRPSGTRLRSAEWYYGPQIWMSHALTVTHISPSLLFDDIRATLAYQFFEESRHDRDFRSDTKHHRTEKVNAYSANVDATKSLGEGRRLLYGLEGVFNRVGSVGEEENIATGVKTPGPSRYPDGATWGSFAVYAQYHHQPRKNLTLQAGARYTVVALEAEFDTTFYHFPFTSASMRNGALTGSVGAAYAPFPFLTVDAALSTAFRSPNVDDVGKVFDSAPGSVVVPNPDLEPEYAYNAELGTEWKLARFLNIHVTTFYTLLRNALVRRNFTLNGMDSILYDGTMSRVQAIQNAAEAHVGGVQARMNVGLPAGFGFTSRFTWMKGEEELDDGSVGPLRHVSPWYADAHATYHRQGLEVDLSLVYNAEVSADDLAPGLEGKDYLYALDGAGRPYCPSWYTLNVKALYRLTDGLTVSAGVENITDRRYRPYSWGITAPERNFIASVKLSF